MKNRDFWCGWVGSVIGMLLLSCIDAFNPVNPTKKQVGYTHQQLREMKAECEKDLPRSTECSITVYYLPQAEQSEEVE